MPPVQETETIDDWPESIGDVAVNVGTVSAELTVTRLVVEDAFAAGNPWDASVTM